MLYCLGCGLENSGALGSTLICSAGKFVIQRNKTRGSKPLCRMHCKRIPRVPIFFTYLGEEFVASEKLRPKGKAFRVSNSRGQLGHL